MADDQNYNLNKINTKLEYEKFHKQAALYWNAQANKRQLELCKQLLFIGSLALIISISIITLARGINFHSAPIVSYSILVSWIFFIISVSSGLAQLASDANYYNDLAANEGLRQSKFGNFYDLPLEDALIEERKIGFPNPKSNESWLKFQQIFFVLGIVFLTISALIILIGRPSM